MTRRSNHYSKPLLVACLVLFMVLTNINYGYCEWVTRQTTVGENLRVFVASNTSSDQTLRFNVEFAPDETCLPWLYVEHDPKNIDVDKIKNVAIQSGPDNTMQLTFHKANNRILQLQTQGPLLMALLQRLQATEEFKLIMRFEAAEITKVFYRGKSALAVCSVQASCWASLMNESDFIFPNSDKEPIRSYALYYLPKDVLKIARNEIFARHGYPFKNRSLQAYFSKKKWYHPRQGKVVLTELEKKNIRRISLFEKSVLVVCPDNAF